MVFLFPLRLQCGYFRFFETPGSLLFPPPLPPAFASLRSALRIWDHLNCYLSGCYLEFWSGDLAMGEEPIRDGRHTALVDGLDAESQRMDAEFDMGSDDGSSSSSDSSVPAKYDFYHPLPRTTQSGFVVRLDTYVYKSLRVHICPSYEQALITNIYLQKSFYRQYPAGQRHTATLRTVPIRRSTAIIAYRRAGRRPVAPAHA